MRVALTLAALALLTGCATMPDTCSGASFRRSVYETTIAAADRLMASGRPVPDELRLTRQATAIALAAVNAHCPVPAA